jgi:hypothetical protein
LRRQGGGGDKTIADTWALLAQVLALLREYAPQAAASSAVVICGFVELLNNDERA